MALMADYDQRNNAAIASSVSFDTTGWEKADTGLALVTDVMATKLAQAQNQPSKGTPVTHTDAVAYAPELEVTPPWVLVSATKNGTLNLYGFVRDGASGAWRAESYSTLAGPLPAPADPGPASSPDNAQLAAVKGAADQLAATLAAEGKGPIALVGESATMVKRLLSDRSGLGAASVTIAATTDPAQGMRVVTTQDGSTVALVSQRVKATFAAKSGSSLSHGPDFAAVLGEPGDRQQLVYEFALFSVLHVHPGDAATMLGSSAGNLMPGD